MYSPLYFRNAILPTLLILAVFSLRAQPIEVPLQPATWDYAPGAATFETYQGRSVIRLNGADATATGSGLATVRDLEFSNGTIEYDIAFTDDTRFTAIHFRRRDDQNSEHFYLRAFWADEPKIHTAVQYAAILNGVNIWDLSQEYQSAAPLRAEGWNRVKLVVRDRQLLAYVNDEEAPVLYVPQLDGDWAVGRIAFDGNAVISNLVVRPGETPGLTGAVGFDPTFNDPRYLRTWQVGSPVDFPQGKAVTQADLPAATSEWQSIAAERHGLVNLSRRFGQTSAGERRLVWLKITLTAEQAKEYLVDFGYNDEVSVWLNGAPLYTGQNRYNTPLMKTPRGRCSIENARLSLPLRAGANELLIGVTNFFFGWGVVARLADAEGVRW